MAQELIDDMRRSVRAFARKEVAPFSSRETNDVLPREIFQKGAAIGLAGLAIADEFGGVSASAELSAAVYTELAETNLGPAIFFGVHNMVAHLLSRFGTAAQHRTWLPQMAAGEILAAFALTEPGAGSNAAALRTVAQETNAGTYTLNGDKCWITSAGFADLYLVFARTSGAPGEKDGISAFIVLPTDTGVSFSAPEKKMGCELSPIASVALKDVELSKDRLLGQLGSGYAVALGGLAGGRINIAACANGLARAAIEKAFRYLKEREQFGQKLIEFQALQFMLADMEIRLEAATALTADAARTLDLDPQSRENRRKPAIAKCYATDAAMQTCTDAVQLLGGAGYVKEYDVERYMRDAKMLQIVEGTNQIQRQIIAREMLTRFDERKLAE